MPLINGVKAPNTHLAAQLSHPHGITHTRPQVTKDVIGTMIGEGHHFV